MAVLIKGLSDIGFCVFSLGSMCVGLMFWIRVAVAFLMFCLCLSLSLVYVCVSGGIVVGVSSLFLWVAGGFLCTGLCICFEFVEVVYDFSWLGLLRVRYKGQSLIEDLLFSCCESFVAQVDYGVCGVRLLSSLVSGFVAGSRLGEFLTN